MDNKHFQKLLDTEYDVLVFCGQPSHWQNVKDIVKNLSEKYPSLSTLIVTEYANTDYPEAIYSTLTIQGLNFKYLNNFKSKIFLTPFVGFPSFCKPIGSQLIHPLVSLTSIDGVYADWMFDSCDYILCAGQHHIDDFLKLRNRRPELNGKVLIKSGYPKLDLVIAWKKNSILDENKLIQNAEVIYAPTHVYSQNEELASLRQYGESIIATILGMGLNLIFRPHPVSLTDYDSNLIDKIIRLHNDNPQFKIDISKEYKNTYSKSNCMITDLSGTGFTFSLGFLKPTIFFAHNYQAEKFLTGIQYEDRNRIGVLARNLYQLKEALKQMSSLDMATTIEAYRNNLVYNIGSSAEYTAMAINDILNDKKNNDFITI